jgi:hypothetical protein
VTLPAPDHLLDYRVGLLDALEAQPAEYARAVLAWPEAEWFTPRDGLGRGPHQMTAHVRDLEVLAYLPRLKQMLERDDAELIAFGSHHWTAPAYRPDEPLAEILRGWAEARAEMVRLLRAGPREIWSRRGFHAPSGWRTVQWWVEQAYRHARQHQADLAARP